MSYVSKPKPCFLDSFEKYKVIDGRQTYRANNKYYQWDEFHGEIEVYNKRGWHLGALDAINGNVVKEADSGRRLHV